MHKWIAGKEERKMLKNKSLNISKPFQWVLVVVVILFCLKKNTPFIANVSERISHVNPFTPASLPCMYVFAAGVQTWFHKELFDFALTL